MKTTVGSKVHPWYKGIHEWKVRSIAELKRPIHYTDPVQGSVDYSPKIMALDGETVGKVLWFPYWMVNDKTKGKMKWGQRPPMLEERILLELIKAGIRERLFSKSFLKKLEVEIKSLLGQSTKK